MEASSPEKFHMYEKTERCDINALMNIKKD
jgi:hypothetical protein